MKTTRFDFTEVENAMRIIINRLDEVGLVVMPVSIGELEYDLKNFFGDRGGYVSLELCGEDDLEVKKITYDKKYSGSHSYSTERK